MSDHPVGRVTGLLRNIRTVDSFRNPTFRLYFFGMMGQWASMSMLMVTQSLLIYRVSGSVTLLGILSLSNAVPQLLFFLFGGALADRFQKRRLIQIGQSAAGAMALVVGIALTTGYLSPEHPGSWWVLIATSIFQGIFMALAIPARQAIIPEFMPRDKVMNAVALNTIGTNVFRLVAPAVAGFLIDGFGFAVVYYIMSGLYAVAVFLTAFIPVTGKTPMRTTSTLTDASEGLRYIWHRKTIFLLLVYAIFFIVLSMPYQMMLPVFADSILKVGASGMGLLQSMAGIGALVSSLILASLPSKKRGIIVLAGGLIMGLGLVAFAFSQSWPLSLGIMVVVGIGQSSHSTAIVTLLQTLSDPEYLGRVISILMMNQGLSSLGTFFVSLLAGGIGVQRAIGGFAIGLAVMSLFFLLFLPRVRKLE